LFCSPAIPLHRLAFVFGNMSAVEIKQA
jgi:hypothetical protein